MRTSNSLGALQPFVAMLLLPVGLAVCGWTQPAAAVPITTNLMIQLDGTNVTTVGTAVSSWNDQATIIGGTQNFMQGTAANQPTLQTGVASPNASLHNVVAFNRASNTIASGADYLVRSSDSALNLNSGTVAVPVESSISWFTVFRMDDTANSGPVLNSAYQTGTDNNRHTLWATVASSLGPRALHNTRNATGGVIQTKSNDAGQYGTNAFTIGGQRWVLASAIWNTSTNELTGRYFTSDDGINLLDTGSFTIAGANSAEGLSHFATTIGGQIASGGSDLFLTGIVAEVLIYNTALSTSDFNAVNQYLAAKYLIPEPSSLSLLTFGMVTLFLFRRKHVR